MGRIPDLKRLTVEDFKAEDREMVKKIAFVINSFHEQVRNLFNGNIDETNLAEQFVDISFTTDDNGQPINALQFRSTLNDRVKAIFVGNIQVTSSNSTFPTQSPLFSFSQNGELVTIENITGLLPATRYSVTLLLKA